MAISSKWDRPRELLMAIAEQRMTVVISEPVPRRGCRPSYSVRDSRPASNGCWVSAWKLTLVYLLSQHGRPVY